MTQDRSERGAPPLQALTAPRWESARVAIAAKRPIRLRRGIAQRLRDFAWPHSASPDVGTATSISTRIRDPFNQYRYKYRLDWS